MGFSAPPEGLLGIVPSELRCLETTSQRPGEGGGGGGGRPISGHSNAIRWTGRSSGRHLQKGKGEGEGPLLPAGPWSMSAACSVYGPAESSGARSLCSCELQVEPSEAALGMQSKDA